MADAVIDIHTGALWGYYRYVGVYKVGDPSKSQKLALALGLPQVLLGQPEDHSFVYEAAKEGKPVASVWIGGGPGLRDYRQDDMTRIKNTVMNAMKQMQMLDYDANLESETVDVLDLHTILKTPAERGFIFMNKEKRGSRVKAGEKLGEIIHPFTGNMIAEILAPRDGIVVHAGVVMPLAPDNSTLMMIGNLLEHYHPPQIPSGIH